MPIAQIRMIKKLIMKNLCPKEEDFADYLEGRLTAARRDELEAHFLKCENCMTELMAINSVLSDKDKYAEDAVPEKVIREAANMAKKHNIFLPDLMIRQIKQIPSQIYSPR